MATISKTSGELVSCLVDDIFTSYLALSELPALDPSPKVNALFGKLVNLCQQTLDDATVSKVLCDPRIFKITPQLRQLCADGEFRLEAYWSEKILRFDSREEVNATLHSFTYYQNYVDLIRMELNALASVALDEPPRKFAVLGSGPLPLTSICILNALNKASGGPVSVHNVDIDPWAISASSKLCRRLGHESDTMQFHCTDASSPTLNLYEFDVVYLAALVGISTKQKQDHVLDLVSRMRPGAMLMLRSAHSLRGLLYPVVALTDDMASMGLEPQLVIHPYNHIINSIIVARVNFPSAYRL